MKIESPSKSTEPEPVVICVPTGQIETSRCDGCDQTGPVKVYIYKKRQKVILRDRLCPNCAPESKMSKTPLTEHEIIRTLGAHKPRKKR